MSLRLVKPGGPKPPKPPRRGGKTHSSSVFTPEEKTRMRQAFRNLRDAFGTWACMARAMDVPDVTLRRAANARRPISAALIIRASKASGLSIAELLGGPIPAERCRACGQIKRRAA